MAALRFKSTACCLVIVLSCFFLAEAQGVGECQELQSDLMTCIMGIDLDLSRLHDPDYREEGCRGLRSVMGCVEDYQAVCPDPSDFPEQLRASLDTIHSAIYQLCPDSEEEKDVQEQGEDQCPDFMGDFQNCYESLAGLHDPQDMQAACQASGQYMECMDELVVRCSGHPALSNIQDQMDTMRQHLRIHCSNVSEECSNVVEDFSRCSFIMQNVTTPEQMCQAGRDFVECAEEVQARCSGHSALANLQEGMDAMREHLDSVCSYDHEKCEDVKADVKRCWQDIRDAYNSDNRTARCLAMGQFVQCVEGLQDSCAGHPYLKDMESWMDSMRQELKDNCSYDHEMCQDVKQNVKICWRDLRAAYSQDNHTAKCLLMGQFVQCVEGLEASCAGHPDLTAVDRDMGIIRKELREDCSYDHEKCQDVKENVMNCWQLLSRADSMDNHTAKCLVKGQFAQCVEGLLDTCAGHPDLKDIDGAVDYIREQIKENCSYDHEKCQNVREDVDICWQDMRGADSMDNHTAKCLVMGQFVQCVEGLQDTCAGHPDLKAMEKGVDLMRQQLKKNCSNDHKDCSDVAEDMNGCLAYITDMQNAVNSSGICRAGNLFLQCLEELQDRCPDHPDASLESGMDSFLEHLNDACSSASGQCSDVAADLRNCSEIMMSASNNRQNAAAMCQAGHRFMTCVEEVHSRCPDDPALQSLPGSVDDMRQQLESMCSNISGQCSDVAADLRNCTEIITSVLYEPDNAAALCQAGHRFQACVEEVQNRCPGDPALHSLPSEEGLRQQVKAMCSKVSGQCSDVAADLRNCSEIMMSAANNPPNAAAMCQAGHRFMACVEEVHDKCPDDPALQSLPVSVDDMRQQLESMCSNASGQCSDVMGDLRRCSEDMMSGMQSPENPGELCQARQGFMACVEEVHNRCPDDPALNSLPGSMDDMRQQLESICSNSSGQCSDVMGDLTRCSEDMMSGMQSPENPGELCQAGQGFMACVEEVHNRCPDDPALNSLPGSMDAMRQQLESMCSSASGQCSDVAADLRNCTEIIMSAAYNQQNAAAMCQAGHRFTACVEEVHNRCPDDPELHSLPGLVDEMRQQLESMCSNSSGQCSDVMGDLTRCSEDMMSGMQSPENPGAMCQAGHRFMACVEEVHNRCPDDPALQALPGSMDDMRQQLESMCSNGSGQCSDVMGDLTRCNEDMMSGMQSPENPGAMCQVGRRFLSCVEEVESRCPDDPALNSLPLDDIRQQLERPCSDLGIRSEPADSPSQEVVD